MNEWIGFTSIQEYQKAFPGATAKEYYDTIAACIAPLKIRMYPNNMSLRINVTLDYEGRSL